MNRFAEEWATGLAALTFYTRIPAPRSFAPTSTQLARSITWFPVVGWLVGGASAAAWWTTELAWPVGIAAGVAIAVAVLVTGALHEDGWADVCDGFGGGRSRVRTLEIMKDPHIGVFGVLGLVLLIGLEWTALVSLPPASVPVALVCAHSLSRGTAASLMAMLDYARPDGTASKARPVVTRLRGGRLAVVLITGAAPLALLGWTAALALTATATIMALAWTLFLRRRLGGYTGDCLGAVQQLTQLACLLVLVGIA